MFFDLIATGTASGGASDVPTDSQLYITVTLAVILAALFGALGGCGAAFMSRTEDGSRRDRLWPDSFVLGICGAIGFIFFTVAIGGIALLETSREILRLISTSLIAGFGARRLLPIMVTPLEKQMAELERRYEEQQNEIHEVEERSKHDDTALIYIVKLRDMKDELSKKGFLSPENAVVLDSIRDFLTRTPSTMPGMWIDFAKVLKMQNDVAGAIEILDTFLKRAGEAAARGRDMINISNAYYNKACYEALMLSRKHKRERMAKDFERIFALLRKSASTHGDFAAVLEEAKNDSDFMPLMQTDEHFQELLAQKAEKINKES